MRAGRQRFERGLGFLFGARAEDEPSADAADRERKRGLRRSCPLVASKAARIAPAIRRS